MLAFQKYAVKSWQQFLDHQFYVKGVFGRKSFTFNNKILGWHIFCHIHSYVSQEQFLGLMLSS